MSCRVQAHHISPRRILERELNFLEYELRIQFNTYCATMHLNLRCLETVIHHDLPRVTTIGDLALLHRTASQYLTNYNRALRVYNDDMDRLERRVPSFCEMLIANGLEREDVWRDVTAFMQELRSVYSRWLRTWLSRTRWWYHRRFMRRCEEIREETRFVEVLMSIYLED